MAGGKIFFNILSTDLKHGLTTGASNLVYLCVGFFFTELFFAEIKCNLFHAHIFGNRFK